MAAMFDVLKIWTNWNTVILRVTWRISFLAGKNICSVCSCFLLPKLWLLCFQLPPDSPRVWEPSGLKLPLIVLHMCWVWQMSSDLHDSTFMHASFTFVCTYMYFRNTWNVESNVGWSLSIYTWIVFFSLFSFFLASLQVYESGFTIYCYHVLLHLHLHMVSSSLI